MTERCASAKDVIADIVSDWEIRNGFEVDFGKCVNDYADEVITRLRAQGFAVVPVEKSLEADNVSAWLMHDNHTFTRLTGPTVADVVAQALMVHEQTKDGMLCPVTVMSGKVELRRVGKPVHLYNKNGEWQKDLAEWLSAVISDPDISRLLKAAQGAA